MLAILSPLHDELRTLRTFLEVDSTTHLRPSTIWRGRIGPHELSLVRCGIGASAMRRAAGWCVKEMHVTQLLAIGFAGATTPHAHFGDLMIGTEIVDATSGKTWSTSPSLREQAVAICQGTGRAATEGVIVTVPAIVSSPHEKAFLGTQHHAVAVDMESSALAEVATATNTPWLVLRAIVDTMEMPLPEHVAQVHPDGTIAYCKFFAALCRHPREWPLLPRLHLAATKAREAITTFAKQWITKYYNL